MIKINVPKLFLFVLVLGYLGTFTACSTTRIVKPLEAKEVMLGLDFGGPLIDFAKTTIPLPFSSVVGAYGINSNFTTFGAFHITSALMGTAQVDLGAIYRVYSSKKQYIPSISTGLSTHLLLDGFKGAFRVYPVADVNLYWQYLKSGNNYIYLNWSSWFDCWNRADGQPNKKSYRPSFSLGHTFENTKMRYTIEFKYMLPGEESGGTPVLYKGIGGKGGIGIYLGVSRKF